LSSKVREGLVLGAGLKEAKRVNGVTTDVYFEVKMRAGGHSR
jgi:hypothetical protein